MRITAITATTPASPTWLVVLQAVSYSFAVVAVLTSIIVYFASGARFRVRAFADKRGQIIVEFYNRGRLAGTLTYVGLARKIPRKQREDGEKWYEIKSASGLPKRLEPGGFEEIRIESGKPVQDPKDVFVSVRYGAGNYRRKSLRLMSGALPGPPNSAPPKTGS
jgi:hypothetical protein